MAVTCQLEGSQSRDVVCTCADVGRIPCSPVVKRCFYCHSVVNISGTAWHAAILLVTGRCALPNKPNCSWNFLSGVKFSVHGAGSVIDVFGKSVTK